MQLLGSLSVAIIDHVSTYLYAFSDDQRIFQIFTVIHFNLTGSISKIKMTINCPVQLLCSSCLLIDVYYRIIGN